MRRIFSHRPSAAMIVALLALFIALGGVSYGVATIGTGDIKNRAVTTKKLKNGAVTTKKLKNGAVTTKKLRNRAVTGTKVKIDGLGGDVINESSLGKVPSAANADNATTADTARNATALDGPLASGKTLRGNFSVAGTNNPNGFVDESSISFAIPLASAPTFNVRTPGSPPNTACPGTPAQPEAAPGNACFYETNLTNTTGALAFRNPGRFGVSFFTPATAVGSYLARGRWAVTAP
jgi:hypothetical protein